MLRRYLPDPERPLERRRGPARAMRRRARWCAACCEAHDAELPAQRPHAELIALTSHALDDAELAASLQRGWTLAIDGAVSSEDSPTPVTRIALPVSPILAADADADRLARLGPARAARSRHRARDMLWAAGLVALAALSVPWLGDAWMALQARDDAACPHRIGGTGGGFAGAGAEAWAGATPAQVATVEPSIETSVEPPAEPAAVAAPASAVAAPAPRAPRAAARATRAPVATKAPRATARATARPTARPPSRPAVVVSERERALAYLAKRGPAPLSAQAPRATPAPALAAAPAPAPAPPPLHPLLHPRQHPPPRRPSKPRRHRPPLPWRRPGNRTTCPAPRRGTSPSGPASAHGRCPRLQVRSTSCTTLAE